MTNPLLEVSYKGATGALIHVSGGEEMTLDNINKVGELVTESLDVDANCIWGARVDADMGGKIRVMAIITGVQSPYVLGKPLNVGQAGAQRNAQMGSELGIDMVR